MFTSQIIDIRPGQMLHSVLIQPMKLNRYTKFDIIRPPYGKSGPCRHVFLRIDTVKRGTARCP
ncbi:11570_t:CDS:1, partial [Dentiscutata heterogama]